MSTTRRIAKVEGTLSPTAATLLWLSDAHAFPTLGAYVAWLVDQPPSAAPLYRVPQTTEAGVRAAMRGEQREAIERSVRDAVRQAVFLIELVMKLNTAAEETVRTEGLRYSALFWEMRAIRAEAPLEGDGPARETRAALTARRAAWRGAVAGLISRLYAAEEARAHVERRYLERSPTLFPDVAVHWQALREQAERLAGLDDALAATSGGANGTRRHGGGSSRRPTINLRRNRAVAHDRAPQEATSLVDTARAAALDALGDTDGAATIAAGHLRLRPASRGRPRVAP